MLHTPVNQQSHPATQADGDVNARFPGFTRRWLDDRRIVIYTLRDVSRPTVDRAKHVVLETMENWPRNQLYLAGYEFAAPTVALSPYLRHGLEQLRRACPDLRGYIAVLAGPGIITLAMNLFLRENHTDFRPSRVFSDDDQALTWLRSHLPPSTQP